MEFVVRLIRGMPLSMPGLFLLLLLLMPLGATYAANFDKVSDNVYRGPRPSAADLFAMKAQGIRTIIDIENDSAAIQHEAKIAQGLDLNFYSVPLSGFWAPRDEDIQNILELMQTDSLRPVLVHCKHGQDRTGLIVGLYRVFYQNWQPEAAYQEMLNYGFHAGLFLLDRYFREKTGYMGMAP